MAKFWSMNQAKLELWILFCMVKIKFVGIYTRICVR